MDGFCGVSCVSAALGFVFLSLCSGTGYIQWKDTRSSSSKGWERPGPDQQRGRE
jgi:hypothetical protein